jgi:hypothetical protein
MIDRHVPHESVVDREVGVDEAIAHARHAAPGKLAASDDDLGGMPLAASPMISMLRAKARRIVSSARNASWFVLAAARKR